MYYNPYIVRFDWGVISVCVCVCACAVHQTKLLKKAMTMLENEKQVRKDERERILAERVPGLQLSGLSLQDLQVHLSFKNISFGCDS